MRFTRSAARCSAARLGSRYAGFCAPCAPAFHAAAQQTNPVAANLNPNLFIVSLTIRLRSQCKLNFLKNAAAVEPDFKGRVKALSSKHSITK
jgi:hypothetical protein